MELQQYLSIVRRYWRSALAVLLLSIAAAAGLTLLQKPTYTSTASLFMVVQSGETAGELSQGATYAERQVKSYVAVAESASVLQPVIDKLNLDLTVAQLASKVSVTAPTATSVIKVTATDRDPARAAELSNEVSSQLVAAVERLSPKDANGSLLVSATMIDPAGIATTPTSPRPTMNLALGAIVGLLLAFGQALLRELLDTRLRTSKDVEGLTEAPLLASIGHVEITGADRTAPTSGAQWANAEAYRRLRTNVGFVGLGGQRRPSMVMTSSLSGEGKTETVVNLARVLAEAGESVLLIDADLRRPQVAARMRLDNEVGLSEVLTGRASFDDLVINVIPGKLAVLPSGAVPPNPSELLGSEAMSALLANVEGRYDHVLFDAPPLLPVTDAVVLGAKTAGAIMVARSGIVRKPQFEAATELLEAGSVPLLGIVLNDVPITRTSSYGGYYQSNEQRSAPAGAPTLERKRRLRSIALVER